MTKPHGAWPASRTRLALRSRFLLIKPHQPLHLNRPYPHPHKLEFIPRLSPFSDSTTKSSKGSQPFLTKLPPIYNTNPQPNQKKMAEFHVNHKVRSRSHLTSPQGSILHLDISRMPWYGSVTDGLIDASIHPHPQSPLPPPLG